MHLITRFVVSLNVQGYTRYQLLEKIKQYNMRIFLLLAFSLMISTMSMAQDATYTAENEGWLVDVDEAYAESQKTGKPILANFTGSDWCGWCKKLTKSVFVHKEFKDWANKNVVLLELDFPRRKQLPARFKQQNQNLQQAFKVRGYPTVWLFDLSKESKSSQYSIEAHGKTGYTKTASEFTANMDRMLTQRDSGE